MNVIAINMKMIYTSRALTVLDLSLKSSPSIRSSGTPVGIFASTWWIRIQSQWHYVDTGYWNIGVDFVICFSTDDYADEYDVDDGDLRAPVHAVTYNGVAQLVLETVREIGCHFNQSFRFWWRHEDQWSNWDHTIIWHLIGYHDDNHDDHHIDQ